MKRPRTVARTILGITVVLVLLLAILAHPAVTTAERGLLGLFPAI